MSTAGSRPYPDPALLAELIQKIRDLADLLLSKILEQSRNSKVDSRLIMASGLLDGAIDRLSTKRSQSREINSSMRTDDWCDSSRFVARYKC